MSDLRRRAPAAERNREPILEVLRGVLPQAGTILEIASGTGEHAIHFARAFPALRWQPSDPDPDALVSIKAWQDAAGLQNVAAPLPLDAAAETWPVAAADAILCINMVHISPWEATCGLMRGAGRLLPAGAPLVLYGPYLRAGIPTAASNLAFDESLKSRDPRWGLRDVDAVSIEAEGRGLRLERLIEMPANNLTLVYRRI